MERKNRISRANERAPDPLGQITGAPLVVVVVVVPLLLLARSLACLLASQPVSQLLRPLPKLVTPLTTLDFVATAHQCAAA